MTGMKAKSRVGNVIEFEMGRRGKTMKIGNVGSRRKLVRMLAAWRTVRWNRWASKDSAEHGEEFPADAPRRLRDVNWKKV